MQNSNPSHTSPGPAAPSIEDEAFARAYERARARILAGARSAGDLVAALLGRCDEQPRDHARPLGTAAAPNHVGASGDSEPRVDHRDAPDNRARVTLDELLPVFREPIEWALARAEQHAQGDPLDLAALDRVRAAYRSRLAWIGSGGALGEARPKLRPTDMITVAGLVVGSIDPSFAQRVAAGAREGLLDALADLVPLGLADAPDEAGAAHPASTFWYIDEIPDAPVPFGTPVPFGARCFGTPPPFSTPVPFGVPGPFGAPVPFGARRVPRPVMPACCCRHRRVP